MYSCQPRAEFKSLPQVFRHPDSHAFLEVLPKLFSTPSYCDGAFAANKIPIDLQKPVVTTNNTRYIDLGSPPSLYERRPITYRNDDIIFRNWLGGHVSLFPPWLVATRGRELVVGTERHIASTLPYAVCPFPPTTTTITTTTTTY